MNRTNAKRTDTKKPGTSLTPGTNLKKVPVLYSSSEEFSKYLAVSMVSLLDNKNEDTFYDIYVLIGEYYNEESLIPFELMKQKYTNFSLNWVEVHDVFADTLVTDRGVGRETLFRLLAAEKLPSVERCIYLDSDTMILNDLTEMYQFDIGDAYICGFYPRRMLSIWYQDYQNNHGHNARRVMEKNMGLVAFDQYVGAGVMTMNLALIRRDHMTAKFLERVKPNTTPKDQDILNACCYGHIAKLPIKYIIDLHDLDDLDWYAENDEGFDELTEIQKALLNPVVIHYADKFKPWKMCGLRYEKQWWHYAVSLGLFDQIWGDFLDEIVTGNGVKSEFIRVSEGKSQTEIYQEAYAKFSKGISYRLGRFLTYIPRKIYYFLRGERI